LQAVRGTEMRNRAVGVARPVQVLSKLEVGRGKRFVRRTLPHSPDNLVGLERVFAASAVGNPITQRVHICVGVNAKLPDQLDSLTDVWRVFVLDHPVEKAGTPRIGRFRRPHDQALLVDPDSRRHVDDAELDVDAMLLVDQRRMPRTGAFDPGAGGRRSTRVKCDRDELKSMGS
jgi:hypothetical protein